jgi:DNA helicase IV
MSDGQGSASTTCTAHAEPAEQVGPEGALRDEIAYHDRVRAAIATMRRSAIEAVDEFHADFEEGKQNRFADDAGPDHHLGVAMASYRIDRLEGLADQDVPLFFGRLWLDSGEDYHLGRRHVRDESDRSLPLVVDWRAPVARLYYQSSAHHRLDVAKRRRFGFRGSAITGFEDEDLRLGQEFASDILTTEIERPRTGPMRDIVATIQPEQDALIRRDADTSLCVQGAPGTGKTAVGLHRAAWLLYTFPRRLAGTGMLVIGPNDSFLRYIASVLPALGEGSVRQTTVDRLLGLAQARGADPPAVTALKHDARMARVCEQAVWSHLGRVTDDLVVGHAGGTWTVPAGKVEALVRQARSRTRGWHDGRKAAEGALVNALVREYEVRTLRQVDSRWRADLKRHPAFSALLDSLWPQLTAKQVLRRLYVDADFRETVCSGVLTEQEAGSLARGPGPLRLSPADLVLLDELKALVRPLTPNQLFGHVVLDEAQDLSPMQCRAIARRTVHGSLTVLGDLAQGTSPWAATDWAVQMRHLGRPEAEFTEMTTGYRVPAVILEVANRLLGHLGVRVSPARSLRRDGTLEVISVDDVVAGAADAVDKALVGEGMIGVIAPDQLVDDLRPALPDSDRVELVAASTAKGLEFDHVLVVEPTSFTELSSSASGTADRSWLRHLYIALTRAVSALTIVTTGPLPPELTEADAVVG